MGAVMQQTKIRCRRDISFQNQGRRGNSLERAHGQNIVFQSPVTLRVLNIHSGVRLQSLWEYFTSSSCTWHTFVFRLLQVFRQSNFPSYQSHVKSFQHTQKWI